MADALGNVVLTIQSGTLGIRGLPARLSVGSVSAMDDIDAGRVSRSSELRTFLHARHGIIIATAAATLAVLSGGSPALAAGVTVGGVTEQSLRVMPNNEQRFQRLMNEWRAARGVASTVAKIAIHPAYQQIIGMGEGALPLIFRELEREPDHWFWALQAITGEDPVPLADQGRPRDMARAWLQWASQRNIKWTATRQS
jgi:hypothetical protein